MRAGVQAHGGLREGEGGSAWRGWRQHSKTKQAGARFLVTPSPEQWMSLVD